MKRLLLPLLAVIALPTTVEANWFGKYKSKIEAKDACNKWVESGFNYSFEELEVTPYWDGSTKYYPKRKYSLKTIEMPNRSCKIENESNQFIGYELTGVKKTTLQTIYL